MLCLQKNNVKQNETFSMFLFRRIFRTLIFILVLTSILCLFILTKHFAKNNIHQYIQAKNTRYTKYHHINNQETMATPKVKHLIKISDHSMSLYIHFDLKGAAPRIAYFERLFPLLHKWGVTGICIEYEDMFPFDGILNTIKHKQAYTKNDIEKISRLAKENYLDIMPLLQTYGHLEFLLKLKEFSDLRENFKYPQVISPCVNRTYTILYSMIDQYLNLHPDIKYFHIGHDEVYYFLTNPECEKFKIENNIGTSLDLFAYHLNRIANYINSRYPNIILLIWHDVLQNLDLKLLEKYNLIKLVNPVLWSYREDTNAESFFNDAQADLFGKYQRLWGASAFKGATSEISIASDVIHYYQNQVSWRKQLHTNIPKKWKNFDGMILTGWSRYDHFLSLCELLPYSIPSMLFSIAAWQEMFKNLPNIEIYPNRLQEYVEEELECSSSIHIHAHDHSNKSPPNCKFPGSDIYQSIISITNIWKQVQETEEFVNKYVTDLHVKYNFIHVKHGEECLEKLIPIIKLLDDFRWSFIKSMNEVFPEYVAIEWLETYFMKRYHSINQRYSFIQRVIQKQNSWLPQPISYNDKN